MEDDNVKTAAVVLNYNDYQTCINFIKEVQDYQSIDRIIIVDNHSSDDSVHRLISYTNDKVLLVKSEENKGYAYGNNIGMKYAIARYPCLEYIVISNPDIHVTEEDIVKILAALDCGYGMSTGIIYNYDPKTQTKSLASNFGWRIPGYGDMISNCFLLYYKAKRSLFHSSIYLDWENVKEKMIIETDAVPGCFFIIKSNAASSIDYMDEDTFLFGEETILAYRLKQKGYRSCIVNNTQVLHENSITINKHLKKNISKAGVRLDSEIVYLEKYLRSGRIGIFLYKILFWLGQIEKNFVITIIRKNTE